MSQTDILKEAHLVANSPHNAFYNLTLERITDGYLVRKERAAMAWSYIGKPGIGKPCPMPKSSLPEYSGKRQIPTARENANTFL